VCTQLLSEAAPGKLRIVHGDILTYRMDRGFPSITPKPWEEGEAAAFQKQLQSLDDGLELGNIFILYILYMTRDSLGFPISVSVRISH